MKAVPVKKYIQYAGIEDIMRIAMKQLELSQEVRNENTGL